MVYRMTISIADELKEAMDKADLETHTNWSSLAAAAFQKRLGELAEMKQVKDMRDVIQRLKASKIESEEVEYKEGYELGQWWAKNTADYSPLRRLARMSEKQDFDGYFSESGSSAYSRAELLAMNLIGGEADRHDAEEFWELAVGDEFKERIHEDLELLRGFCEGAITIYEEVEDRL
jgi:hypothetical protein